MESTKAYQKEEHPMQTVAQLKVLVPCDSSCDELLEQIDNMEIESEYFHLPKMLSDRHENISLKELRPALDYAEEYGHDLVIAVDFNQNKLCVSARKSHDGDLGALNPHQLAALFSDIITKTHQNIVCYKSLFISDLVEEIFLKAGRPCRSILLPNGASTEGNSFPGEEEIFVVSENQQFHLANQKNSSIYLIGRLLLLSAKLKSHNETLFDQLIGLFRQHGYYNERVFVVEMKFESQRNHFANIMKLLRKKTPERFGDVLINEVTDYESGIKKNRISAPQNKVNGPVADILKVSLANGLTIKMGPREEEMCYFVTVKRTLLATEEYFRTSKAFDERIAKFMENVNKITFA
jgi:hypothetical protein